MKLVFSLILVVFTFCFSVLILTKNYRNYFKLIMVFGKKGSGKSTFLIKKGLKLQKKGYTIYTNMLDCMCEGFRIIDADLIGEYVPEEKSVLLLDEVGMLYDNRNYKNFKSETRDFFKLQRHYKVIVYLASQTFDIDKKLRDLTDYMILTIGVLNVFSIGKKIRKKVTLTESTSQAESRIAENLKFTSPFSWEYTYIPKYQKYYDSFDAPEKPFLPYYENVPKSQNI